MNGQEIKALREKYNETQEELAQAIGTKYNRISEWENGHHKVSKVYERLIKEHYAKKEKAKD